MLFFGAFIMRYRLELILSFPLVSLVMAVYLSLAYKDDSAVQRPEGLYAEPALMTSVAVVRGGDDGAAVRRRSAAASRLHAEPSLSELAWTVPAFRAQPLNKVFHAHPGLGSWLRRHGDRRVAGAARPPGHRHRAERSQGRRDQPRPLCGEGAGARRARRRAGRAGRPARGDRRRDARFAHAELSFVCVGTPSAADGSMVDDYLRSVAEEIGRGLHRATAYHVVVVRSTVLPGTTRNLLAPVARARFRQTGRRELRAGLQPRVPARRHGARRTSATRRYT